MAEKRVHTWVTYALIAANVVMFGVELASGVHAVSPRAAELVPLGASTPSLTLNGEPWRLVAAMFLHFGILHIGLNMVCLWQGRIVELLYGRVAFAVTYVLAGLAGGIASLAVSGSNVVSAGASGAVFGVYGAFGAFLVLRKNAMPEAVWKATARGIGMFVIINIAFGLSVQGISTSAHVGGLVYGFVVGYALLWRSKGGLARPIAVAVGGLAVVTAVFFALPNPAPYRAQAQGTELAVLSDADKAANVAERAVQADHARDADKAARLDREAITPIRTACAGVRGAEPPDWLADSYRAAGAYCEARQAALEALQASYAETDPARKQALHDHYVELHVQAQAALGRANKVIEETKPRN